MRARSNLPPPHTRTRRILKRRPGSAPRRPCARCHSLSIRPSYSRSSLLVRSPFSWLACFWGAAYPNPWWTPARSCLYRFSKMDIFFAFLTFPITDSFVPLFRGSSRSLPARTHHCRLVQAYITYTVALLRSRSDCASSPALLVHTYSRRFLRYPQLSAASP